MSNRHRDRSPRQNDQRVNWEEQFAAFKQQPTWDEYFRLRRKVQEEHRHRHRNRHRQYELWDKLDQLAMPLITQRERVIAVCKAFKLELGNRRLQEVWHNYDLRNFGLDLIKDAWHLPDRPGKQLWFKILKEEDGTSETLRQAADLLQKGHVPPKMSDNDTLALLLWVPVKYFREAEAIKVAKQLRQALPDGNPSEIEPLWEELALLLGPPPPPPPPPEEETVSQAAQEVLMAWQEAVGAFTTLVKEQAAGVAQRDEFISLLQHQISNADQITQEAREKAETKVKRTLMQLLAEPLDQFQVAVALYEERDFALIYESFTQALAQLEITPIGEMDRQFTVSQNDLVRSIDGQPVVGQEVKQLGLGWQLQLSNGTVHPLVRPRVRRLKR